MVEFLIWGFFLFQLACAKDGVLGMSYVISMA